MQGDPRIIDLLNQILRKELTGVNQYFIHSRMCKNWGYTVLEQVHYQESIEEMRHADTLIQRIIFLEGVPNLSDYDPIRVGRTVQEQFDADLELETMALAVLRSGVPLCLEAGDHVTRELLERILIDEEHHVDWLETQKHQIAEMGYQQYLTQQVHARP
jgi:bacterioferritin